MKSRFVEPPKAAKTTIALRTEASERRSPRRDAAVVQRHQRPGAAAGHVEPDRLTRRGQGRMRQRHAQGLAHDLRGGGRAEEMAAAAAGRAHVAADLGRLFQRDLADARSAHRSTGCGPCLRPPSAAP